VARLPTGSSPLALDQAAFIALLKGYKLTNTLLGQFSHGQQGQRGSAILSPAKSAPSGPIRHEASLGKCFWRELEPRYWLARKNGAVAPFTHRELPIYDIHLDGQTDEIVGDRAVCLVRNDSDAPYLVC
jgi:hypothetical protein